MAGFFRFLFVLACRIPSVFEFEMLAVDISADSANTFCSPSLNRIAFSALKVDVAIVEVGIGGRWDTTNVIENPVVTGITRLDLESELENIHKK